MTPRHWCKKLRWKSYGHDREDPARVAVTFAEGCVTYTCLDTASCVALDDELAAPERCTSARACYAPHPLLTLGRRSAES